MRIFLMSVRFAMFFSSHIAFMIIYSVPFDVIIPHIKRYYLIIQQKNTRLVEKLLNTTTAGNNINIKNTIE